MNDPAKSVYEFGEFHHDPADNVLLRKGVSVPLTPQVFSKLVLLVEHRGRLVEKDEFVRALWADAFVQDAALAENISRLRRVLGDNEGQRFIVTVPKRGYRFVADVKNVAAPEAAEPVAPGLAKRRARGWQGLALVGVAVSLALGTSYWYARHSRQALPGAPTVPVRSLAVLPLENLSRDAEQEYFAEGMTDELITQLARIRALRVISRTSVMRFKGTRKPLA